jgi:hypothetical protein
MAIHERAPALTPSAIRKSPAPKAQVGGFLHSPAVVSPSAYRAASSRLTRLASIMCRML